MVACVIDVAVCIVVIVPATLEFTEAVLTHILHGVVACMVHNYIHYYSDTVLMSGVNHCFELCFCTEVFIRFGIVKHIVAVIGIVGEAVAVCTYTVAVNLLIRC